VSALECECAIPLSKISALFPSAGGAAPSDADPLDCDGDTDMGGSASKKMEEVQLKFGESTVQGRRQYNEGQHKQTDRQTRDRTLVLGCDRHHRWDRPSTTSMSHASIAAGVIAGWLVGCCSRSLRRSPSVAAAEKID